MKEAENTKPVNETSQENLEPSTQEEAKVNLDLGLTKEEEEELRKLKMRNIIVLDQRGRRLEDSYQFFEKKPETKTVTKRVKRTVKVEVDGKEIDATYIEETKETKDVGYRNVCKMKTILPVNNLFPYLPNLLLGELTKKVKNAKFNFDPKHGAWIIETVGVAKCSLEDEYDKEKGESIALSRAKAYSYLVVRDIVRISMNHFNKVNSRLKCIEKFMQLNYDKEKEFLGNKLF